MSSRGDVDTEDALARVRQHFDEIPSGPKPAPLDSAVAITSERRLVLEDRVELPRLYLSWLSPAMFTDGDAEMDLLSDLFANRLNHRNGFTTMPAVRVGPAPYCQFAEVQSS